MSVQLRDFTEISVLVNKTTAFGTVDITLPFCFHYEVMRQLCFFLSDAIALIQQKRKGVSGDNPLGAQYLALIWQVIFTLF